MEVSKIEIQTFKIGDGPNFIELNLTSVYGFPDEIDEEIGGYSVKGEVNIQSGKYSVTNGELWFTTGQVYQLYQQLKEAYETLSGKVTFYNYECSIDLEMIFNSTGQIDLEGYFRDSSGDNRLEFGFQLDQSYLFKTLNELKKIVEIYGDMTRIK
ncbi:hypothetical protein FQ087_17640 [Sporosarcina sp. ANT_H38]|uniref:WapI family immunity protein n=1 Tax=Sporosarcina sp. ANT_H38 TaxID=2597358 RepID=UPI0011F12E43|nr:hypothetical protein [Sporosarcina sp. ANT_H38]KAA0948808.1 hypothetical protein FQ087_17640 [Sporosarcina sp. ANT_H38]